MVNPLHMLSRNLYFRSAILLLKIPRKRKHFAQEPRRKRDYTHCRMRSNNLEVYFLFGAFRLFMFAYCSFTPTHPHTVVLYARP